MTWPSATASMRSVPPSHKPWVPLPYMSAAVEHLVDRGAAALWLDPGMRKTSITLAAFDALRVQGLAKKMLVVAPLRVCQLVWRQEGQKWTEFRHLRFSLLHGPKKKKALETDADIYLINPEGVAWLSGLYKLRPASFPFDTVVIDEITKFKNSAADRHKKLRPMLARVKRRWGLTGTPSPNGYMDLFGQFLLLDDGAALGRFITHFRDLYFRSDFTGFNYELQRDGAKRIEERLEPYVFRLSGDDYVQLPELLDDPIRIRLDPASRVAYDAMTKDMLAELPGGVVTAANKAAAYSKMKQMSGGAVYLEDKSVVHLHDAKLDALSDLVDELDGQQLLIGYEFIHEAERIKARFGDKVEFLSGATEKQAEDIQRRWNAGQIKLLACHPASAGHGLNLQEGNAAHVCWFAPIWDLELWDQFTRRLRRSGNEAEHVIRHMLIVENSIDDLALQALEDKDTTQARLLQGLTTLLGRPGGGVEATEEKGETPLVEKLSRAGATPAPGWGPRAAPAEPAAQQAPARGWGRPASVAEPVGFDPGKAAEPTQEEQIRETLTAEGGAFSPETEAALAALTAQQGGEGTQAAANSAQGPQQAPKRRTRAPAPLTPLEEAIRDDERILAELSPPSPRPVFNGDPALLLLACIEAGMKIHQIADNEVRGLAKTKLLALLNVL